MLRNNTKRKSSIKFLSLMLDEHISWTDHVRTVENKTAKKPVFLYCITQFLKQNSLKNCTFLIYLFLLEK